VCQEDSLYQSQINKLDLILDKMDLTPEHHIFEIGCGWGGFACRAVERFGCKVPGITTFSLANVLLMCCECVANVLLIQVGITILCAANVLLMCC
jgi:cyclopropane fatty-acyl-phospholipid synthase-like methyltransferase